ncbi:hypothetical protein [Sporosarcina jiandibaonis]|uniref:hypothetical protein n=1 Tax=Sporosarcina jiandibaonis TaxID=2715535 RepID=UPI0015538D9A|nr:hypothetical protein [Sporosarcina jiandibaonis]
MATKSKNNIALFWSIIALILATVSIGYCFTHIFELYFGDAFRSNRMIVQLTRMFSGGL